MCDIENVVRKITPVFDILNPYCLELINPNKEKNNVTSSLRFIIKTPGNGT